MDVPVFLDFFGENALGDYHSQRSYWLLLYNKKRFMYYEDIYD